VRVRWVDLRAMYRGRGVDAEPLDLRNIERISIMVRRYVLIWQKKGRY
jgi:hypothetical protein